MEINYQVELELSVARRWLLDGNIKRAWLHLGLAKYYHLQEDKAAEHRVQPTCGILRLYWVWFWRLVFPALIANLVPPTRG
jgi:hypothetical protein